MAFVIRGVVLVAPKISREIPDGAIVITLDDSSSDARREMREAIELERAILGN